MRTRSPPPPALLAAAALLALAGCAFTPDVVHLAPEVSAASPVPGAELLEVRVAVEDLRPVPGELVARKINGWGHQMAPISSDAPVADVVAAALTRGLRARGYRVGGEGGVPLVVELFVFAHEFRSGFWAGRSEAQVTFLATVRDRAGRELFRQVVAEAFDHPVQLASGANVKKAYDHALAAAVERLLSSDPFQRAVALAAAPPTL